MSLSTNAHQRLPPSYRTHQSSSSISTLLSSTFSPFSSTSIERRIVPSSVDLSIVGPIGNGTFGEVYFARDEVTGQPLVAKAAKADTPDDPKRQQSANSYLEIEAYVNSKLYNNSTTSDHDDYQHDHTTEHVAPYVGECEVNGTTYLVWEASGEYTLEDYVEMEDGWVQLAIDLGLTDGRNIVDAHESIDPLVEQDNRGNNLEISGRQQLHNSLAAEVLRQVLEGLAYCHSCGIVHRDLKPANILVDPKTRTLRLIDFGSACCMSSWSDNKLGYKGENKGPRSILYCAPEEFVDEKHPYAFDLYGAAVTWIRTVLSDEIHFEAGGNDGIDDDTTKGESTTLELGDEDELFKWRIDIRNFGHNLVAWEEYATLHNSLPHGWDSLFGSSRQGIQALRLLSNMMSYSPDIRMSAAEALVGQYLNPGCDAEPPPELPPAMPFSIMSHIQRWKTDKEVHGGECQLEDLFTRVIAVELEWPLGLQLGPNAGRGVLVTGIDDGTAAVELDLCEGDTLLAIGSIDVEKASLEHVMELLEQWPEDKHVTLLIVRDTV